MTQSEHTTATYPTPAEQRILSQGIHLNVLTFAGDPATTPIVVLHGMRDTAHAFTPTITTLQKNLSPAPPIYAIEHRGHGKSDWSNAYTMGALVLDIYNVIHTLIKQPVNLLCHSMGGHVGTRYAALFPEDINAIVLVDGLGPPRREHLQDQAMALEYERHMLLTRLNSASKRGVLKDHDDVATRLLRNNPRLPEAEAYRLAVHMSQTTPEGLTWAFDSRTSGIFAGVSEDQSAMYWQHVKAPVCVVTGTLTHEYWAKELGDGQWDGRFQEGELEARCEAFADHEVHWLAEAGHMINYDQPHKLGKLAAEFFGRRETRHV